MDGDGKEDWARKCMYMEVEGERPRGRPKITHFKVFENDIKGLGLASADALDRHAWKRRLWVHVLTQVCLELLPRMSGPLNGVCVWCK